jgi:hypothetical protein
VQIDDWRVAGMMLTFPMLNGMALVAARENAGATGQSMVPVVTLNGTLCFLFTLALAWSQTARANPLALTLLATALWICVYAWLETRNVTVPARVWTPFTAMCAILSVALTYWLWPSCAEVVRTSAVRTGGMAGVLEGWIRIALFAVSLLIVFSVAHFFRDAHAAIGRLGALPIVPLFGLYTVASVLGSDPAAVPKLDTMRSMVLVGWMFALLFAVLLAAYVANTARGKPTPLEHLAALIIGWSLCLGAIAASARLAPLFAGCTAQ